MVLLYSSVMTGLVTLLSDFGTRDGYVGAMKGVVLARAPDARLVDLTHDIAPQDVLAGARALRQAVAWFPAGSVHLAVVDPGVGTARRPLLLRNHGRLLVGPDNGLLSLAVDGEVESWVLDREELFVHPLSQTFAGRDLFAPVAGHLAAGRPPESCGSSVRDFVRIEEPRPRALSEGVLLGEVLHVDRFGNLVSNVRGTDLPTATTAEWRVRLGNRDLGPIRRCYGEVQRGEWLAYWGSSGELEIAVREGSAAAELWGTTGHRAIAASPISVEVRLCPR